MPALLKVNDDAIDAAAAVRLSILHNSTFLRDTVRAIVVRKYAEKLVIWNTDKLIAQAKIEYPVFQEEAVATA